MGFCSFAPKPLLACQCVTYCMLACLAPAWFDLLIAALPVFTHELSQALTVFKGCISFAMVKKCLQTTPYPCARAVSGRTIGNVRLVEGHTPVCPIFMKMSCFFV